MRVGKLAYGLRPIIRRSGIVVDEGDIFPSGLAPAAIASGRKALARLDQEPEPRMPSAERLCDFGGIVRGIVVDD